MFERFLQTYPPGAVQPVAEAVIEQYQGVLPEPILHLWRSHGLGSYGSGLLWLVDPSELQPILDMWLIPSNEQKKTPFLRSAFSHVFYYRSDGSIQYLNPHHKQTDFIGTDAQEFFDGFLTADDVRAEVLWSNLYDEAKSRLRAPGPSEMSRLRAPGPSEMFGFVPALCLGGRFEAASTEVVTLAVHNSILVQS
jgi:hypothetical protein